MRHVASSISLYTDDIVVFYHPDEHDAQAIKGILQIFNDVLGLHMNYAKCSTTPIQCSEAKTESFSTLMASQIAKFSVAYLGLPLSIQKLTRTDLLPLGGKLGCNLFTWRACMLSLGSRLTLVRHVLCAMPTHFLVAIVVSQSVLAKVNKIVRGFL